MSKRKNFPLIMAVVMVAMLAFGGTYAYFTATTAGVTKTFTTGIVNLTNNSTATYTTNKVVNGTKLMTAGKITYTNASDVAVWVFVTFDTSFTKDTDATTSVTPNRVASKDLVVNDGDYFLDINLTMSGWEDLDTTGTNTYVYAKKLADTEGSLVIDVCDKITFYGISESVDGVQGSLMGATIELKVQALSIQAMSETDGTDLEAAEAWDLVKPTTT